MALSIKCNIDASKFASRFSQLLTDDATMTAVHNLLFKMETPYVPFDTGTLSQSVEVTADHVKYTQPYAHYMYEGIVYGPNIPIIENGVVVGFFSRPGVKKTPTGRYINYDTAHHARATHHWDQAMLLAEGDVFRKQIEKILERQAKKL